MCVFIFDQLSTIIKQRSIKIDGPILITCHPILSTHAQCISHHEIVYHFQFSDVNKSISRVPIFVYEKTAEHGTSLVYCDDVQDDHGFHRS